MSPKFARKPMKVANVFRKTDESAEKSDSPKKLSLFSPKVPKKTLPKPISPEPEKIKDPQIDLELGKSSKLY